MKRLILVGCVLLTTVACAPKESASLEDAQFALDNSDYDSAITSATDALNENSQNIKAARILASAYLGRSGLSFLDLASGASDLQNNSGTNFSQIADLLGDLDADGLADLQLGIATLSALDGIDDATITNEDLADAAFDLGMMQIIDHFATGVQQSGYLADTFDVSTIEDVDNVIDDLTTFDNHLIAAGVDPDESFLAEIRQAYCILEPLSDTAGAFTLGEYQALVGCQLSDDPVTFDTATPSGGTVANCATIDPDSQSADVEACYATDPT